MAKTSEFMTPGEIGPAFNKGPRWFERNRAKLEAAGFPRPVSKGSYLRAAVLAFRDRVGGVREEQRAAIETPTAKDIRALIERTLAHGRGRQS